MASKDRDGDKVRVPGGYRPAAQLQWVNMVRIITAWYGIGWIDQDQMERMVEILGPRPHQGYEP